VSHRLRQCRRTPSSSRNIGWAERSECLTLAASVLDLSHCDRGQRYCGPSARHQQSTEGLLDHRDRQRDYRQRIASRVTDQGSLRSAFRCRILLTVPQIAQNWDLRSHCVTGEPRTIDRAIAVVRSRQDSLGNPPGSAQRHTDSCLP
jgi:hypothetical protein